MPDVPPIQSQIVFQQYDRYLNPFYLFISYERKGVNEVIEFTIR